MNLAVAMKQIPDLQQVRIRNRQPVWEDVPLTLGHIDKNALEAGLELKESMGGAVIALSVGNEEVEDTIKEALAAGADQAFLIADDAAGGLDSAQVAPLLAAAVGQMEDIGLLLLGEGSGDNYSGQVASRVAAILGWPQLSYAKAITVEGDRVTVVRSLEDGDETISAALPAVVTVVAEINEARIPTVTQILKAGKKPKEVLTLDDLDLDLTAPVIKTLSNLAPESSRRQIEVKSVADLIAALKAENLL